MTAALDQSRRSRRAARTLAWPVRRVLDARFSDIAVRLARLSDGVQQEHAAVRARMADVVAGIGATGDALVELAAHVGDRLDRFEASVDALEKRLASLELGLDATEPVVAVADDGGLEEISRAAIEEPWAMRSLAGLAAGARIHVATAGRTALPAALAALGHAVETPDPPLEGYPGWTSELQAGACAVAIALGVLDHGDREQRLEALRSTLAPDGVLALAIRVGVPEDAGQDMLDTSAVPALLEGWTVMERLELARTSATTWEPAAVVPGEGVLLVRARPPGG